MDIKVVAVLLRSQQVVEITSVIALSVIGTLGSPAISCRIDFSSSQKNIEIGAIKVLFKEKLLFEGSIDFQRTSINAKGVLCTLEARSKGALLLDNEALPETLWGGNLTTIFQRHIAPHGFSLVSDATGRTVPQFSIHKGMSQWDVFSRYARRLYGVIPYLVGNAVFARKTRWQEELVISNTKIGHPFTEIAHEIIPYEMISNIVLRNGDGIYDTTIKNPGASYFEIERTRYHIPSTEFENNLVLDGNQRIQRSMYLSERWTVTLPEILTVSVGMGVSIIDDSLSKRGLLIDTWEHSVSAEGYKTKLSLRDATYW